MDGYLLKQFDYSGERTICSVSNFDQRAMDRFALKFPVRLTHNGKNGGESADLHTTDICAGGAFLQTKAPLAEGTKVEVELFISMCELRKLKGNKARILVIGSVTRCEKHGMAVCFNSHPHISSVPDNVEG